MSAGSGIRYLLGLENTVAASNMDNQKNDPEAAKEAVAEKAKRQLKRGRLTMFAEKLSGGPQRPGQQKIGRSPVVLVLTGVTLLCFLLSGIFWYINQWNAEERMLKEATSFLEQQKYIDAEVRFSQFLQAYPKTVSTPKAKIGLHRTLVEKYILTNTPDVIRGMAELRTMISECGDLPGYGEIKDTLRRYADRLAYAGAIVAETIQSEEALTVSREAMDLLRRFSGDGGITQNREQFLQERQRIAEGAIARKLTFKATTETIASQLAAGNTLAAIETRQALIDRYPSLKDDRDVRKMLSDILMREKELTVRTDLGWDALPADPAVEPLPAVSLSLRTQGQSDLVSQGRFIVTIGLDSCCSVDADTGDPRWKHIIGADAPFAPLPVTGTTPGVLVYSTLTAELQMLAEDTGKVLWRQTTGSRPSAAPLIVSGTIYLTTDDGELLQIAAVNGRALAKIKFPQTVIGPPAVSSDGQKLVLPGDQTLVYSISLNPFACQTVSQIPHRVGSIRAPMFSAGRYYLMCDNESSEKSRIQTLQEEASGELTVVASNSVDGQIQDPALLRGYELFVPSTPQRISAFRVGDEPGQPPLAFVGANQLEEAAQTRMFLLAGPGGQVWLAGRDLRKFRTRTNGVELDPGLTAQGVHTQPIQLLDEAVFVTTRAPQSGSFFFTRADREQMQGVWRTVLSSRIVAMTGTAAGGSVLALTDYGEAYRVPLADLQKESFVLESVSRLRLPEKLVSPVEGIVLADGRPAAWVGAPEPSMWTFTTTGQLEQKWTLPAVPEIPPVAIDAGVVFASSGRLHLTAMSGGKTAEDYRSSQTQNQQQPWKSMVALSGTQILAVTAANQFVRVEYRESPRPQLAEVSVTKVASPIEVPPAVSGGFLFAATTEGKLLMMQASTLEVLAEKDLGGVPSAQPKVSDQFVIVEVANQQAKIFRIAAGLPEAGTLPLEGWSLRGNPLPVEGGLLVARSDGLLTKLDNNGAATDVSMKIGQQIQSGFVKFGEQIIITGLDGSLYSINPALRK
ncbi:MAG: PQQ-binding-like beta-propeller repeat protein [Planctomycetia bacterium]